MLVKVIAAIIELLGFGRKVEKKMRFDLALHDHDALFNLVAKQKRGQDVMEANDASRRQKLKRRDARSVASAGTKPQGRGHDENEPRESSKAAGIYDSCRYDNNECCGCGMQCYKQLHCPKASRVRRGKAFMAIATARPSSSSSLQAVPLN